MSESRCIEDLYFFGPAKVTPDGKHKQNSNVMITLLIVNADKATMHYGDRLHGGL